MELAVNGDRKLSTASLTAFHETRRELSRALRDFDFHVDAVLSDPRLSKPSAKFLERIWYTPRASDELTLAHRSVREALTDAVMVVLLRHCESIGASSHGLDRLRLLSACPDVGYCDYGRGKLPLQSVSRKLVRCMRRRKLEGAAIVDFALIDVEHYGEPKKIGVHFHAACRPLAGTGVNTPPTKARRKSMARNKFGLAVVQQNVLKDPLTTRDVARLGYYMSKPSAGLKEAHDTLTRRSQTLWSSEHALRMLEACSHISPSAALIPVGEFGRTIRDECLDKLGGFLGRSCDGRQRLNHGDLSQSWERLYGDLGLSDELRPLRLDPIVTI